MNPKRILSVSVVSSRRFLIALLLLSVATLLRAERHSRAGVANAAQMTTAEASNYDLAPDRTNQRPATVNEYACFLPPLNSIAGDTIGVVDLRVPWKAKSEYQTGCNALQKKKFDDAEKHLRKAVLQYAKYAAAWVLLGQVLESQKKPDEARDACSKSLDASASYLAGYLCLTDISTRQKNWEDALKFSARVLEIDPTTNAIAYAYHATANLQLHHLAEAEKSALKALQLDVRNSEPRIHFLLAQVYAAKGDRANTAAQLREYLKFAKDPDDIAMVNKTLTKINAASGK